MHAQGTVAEFEKALAIKEEGNASFEKGRIPDALRQYTGKRVHGERAALDVLWDI